MSGERLEELRTQLAQLQDAPVSVHPTVLDEVHRALVAELEMLARTAGPTGEGAPADPA